MRDDIDFESLGDDEAWGLLVDGTVGRLSLSIGALPVILPVHYGIDDGDIVFWTTEGSAISAAAEGSVVAFAVDEYERQPPSGRSVLAVGVAGLTPTSVPGEAPGCLVRIRPELLSGRRLAHDRVIERHLPLEDGPGRHSGQ
jgi:hypothetical protein